MEERTKKILSSLQAQCAKREYCRSDIFRKALEKAEWDRCVAEEVTESLVKDGFVDDLRYSSAFAREKASLSGWGPVKIRFMLSGKGIDKTTIDKALEEIDPDAAFTKLKRLLENKWKAVAGEDDAKLRMLKFALSKGYEYEAVRAIVDRITSDGQSEA